jgi:DNA-directed RNA polymerase subunit RPC12/RpoP
MITGNHDLPEQIKVYHEAKCARCGHRLTVPESIETGFGPNCLEKAFG